MPRAATCSTAASRRRPSTRGGRCSSAAWPRPPYFGARASSPPCLPEARSSGGCFARWGSSNNRRRRRRRLQHRKAKRRPLPQPQPQQRRRSPPCKPIPRRCCTSWSRRCSCTRPRSRCSLFAADRSANGRWCANANANAGAVLQLHRLLLVPRTGGSQPRRCRERAPVLRAPQMRRTEEGPERAAAAATYLRLVQPPRNIPRVATGAAVVVRTTTTVTATISRCLPRTSTCHSTTRPAPCCCVCWRA